MTGLIRDNYWFARCGCGWVSKHNTDADIICNKVKTHLLAFHRETECDIVITCSPSTRQAGKLPQQNPPGAAEATVEAARRLAEPLADSPQRTPGDAP